MKNIGAKSTKTLTFHEKGEGTAVICNRCVSQSKGGTGHEGGTANEGKKELGRETLWRRHGPKSDLHGETGER